MSPTKKDRITTLLKGIETGDPAAVEVVDEARYVQHNPMTREGSEGLAELFARLATTSPRVVLHRVFEDGDFVFAHVEYDFAEVVAGFEVFRFEGGFAVEHWDNLQHLAITPNHSGHTVLDGPTVATDQDRTEANRALVRSFVDEVLVGRRLDRIEEYVETDMIEHDSSGADGAAALQTALAATTPAGEPAVRYDTIHRVLADGNFVLCAAEGSQHGAHSANYDLFRVHDDRIAEHWCSVEPIPPRDQWNNDNGKF